MFRYLVPLDSELDELSYFNCTFTGLSSMTIPMYIAESAPAMLRGRLVTMNNLFITAGQLVASIIDGLFSGNKENGWR